MINTCIINNRPPFSSPVYFIINKKNRYYNEPIMTLTLYVRSVSVRSQTQTKQKKGREESVIPWV